MILVFQEPESRDLFAQEGGYGVTEETYELLEMLNLTNLFICNIWLGKTVREI